MRPPRRPLCAGSTAFFALLASAFVWSQESTPPVQLPTPALEKGKNQRSSHANDFLILGTVFDPRGLSFPGVKLRVRRSAEKKFRWESYTNSRGEFAVRVPRGTVYEMLVHAEGFADQTRQFDAKTGGDETRIVVRMEPVPGEKK